MDIAQAERGAASRKFAVILPLALFMAGCGGEPVNPGIDPEDKGFIKGYAYLAGAVGYPPVRIDISVASTSEVVSSVISNTTEGRFESDAIEGGIYDLTATTAIFGYSSPRLAKGPGRTSASAPSTATTRAPGSAAGS